MTSPANIPAPLYLKIYLILFDFYIIHYMADNISVIY